MNFIQKIKSNLSNSPFGVIFEIIFVLIPIAVLIRTIGFGFYIVPTGSMEPTLLVGERFFADKLSYYFRKPQRGEIIAFDDPTYQYSSNAIMNFWERYFSPSVSNWTKRVIGIPGDTVKGTIEDGKPVVYLKKAGQDKFEKLDESAYINKYPLIAVRKYDHYYNPGHYKEERDVTWKTFNPSLSWDKQIFYKINLNRIILNNQEQPLVLWPDQAQPDEDIFEVALKDNEYWVMGDNRRGSLDCRAWGRPPYGSPLNAKLIHGRILFRIWSMDTDESWILLDLIKHPIEFFKKVRWSRNFQFVS